MSCLATQSDIYKQLIEIIENVQKLQKSIKKGNNSVHLDWLSEKDVIENLSIAFFSVSSWFKCTALFIVLLDRLFHILNDLY